MAKLESTTIIVTVSTRLDGAKIERQWLQRSVLISDAVLRFLAVALIWIEAAVLTCGDVWYSLTIASDNASYMWSDYLSLYFVGQCWRWLICG